MLNCESISTVFSCPLSLSRCTESNSVNASLKMCFNWNKLEEQRRPLGPHIFSNLLQRKDEH
jgi:hypothetical protein